MVMDKEIPDDVDVKVDLFVTVKELHSSARKHYLQVVQVQIEIFSRSVYLDFYYKVSYVPSYN